ncbi:MAG: valine--tRNA ligase [Candidatus Pacebacteria bacterium]|nr:valine--tRNA ligase [Candidatus Paceibacterota bacterium]
MQNENIPDKFLKPYNPQQSETGIYAMWEKSGYFNPDICIEKGITDKDAEHFSIVLPPPNVTGTLHLGHALENSLQDTFVRFNRMLGKRTLWVPGTDHAAIATQSKVEKELIKKEKKNRHVLGREEFLKRVEKFAQESHDTIVNQVRKLGASLDWSREAFTLDKTREHAVRTVFKNMYDKGLIYRGERAVNWDPKGQTVISDDEIVHEERTEKFYYFKYGPFIIGTARPETKFGDKYVVMHPDDKRYKKYEHGQKVELEWINGPMTATVIKDKASDPEMGSGVMTITPWHSIVDFEIAERHDLDKEQIIDQYGKLLPIAGEFEGMKITEAREKIVEKLEAKGLVEKIEENYVHNVPTAERSGGLIEPQIMRQWFIDVNKEFTIPHSEIKGIESGSETTLKEIMHETVSSGQIEILPERFEKVYHHWINNLRDWNISRQIWYGHRIPVWYKKQTGEITNPGKSDEVYVGVTAPEGDDWVQDEDTLDTWFSSGLWTFSTLGWPEDTEDMRNYHPTSLMAPGYEILFFWVARMVLMTGFSIGTIPFKTVYLHGMLRAKDGRKFSKSLNNGIDPIDMIDKYGTDALRFSLIVGVTPGNDMKFDEMQVNAYKKFANKLWNITRFILTETHGKVEEKPELTDADEDILSELNDVSTFITEHLEKHRIDLAADKIYHYLWHEIADKILEESKPVLQGSDVTAKRSRQWVLYEVLTTSLKLLHPFMPFVTEDIWQSLPYKENDMLMVAKWPN